MSMGRYLVPGLPFLAIVIARLPNSVHTRASSPLFIGSSVALVLALQVAPAFDLHLAPHSLRSQFHFRHNTETYRSEFQQWKFMRRTSEKLKYIGLTLILRCGF